MKIANPIRILEDESGATAIEYGMIAGLVTIVCITALQGTGDTLKAVYERIEADLAAALS